MPRERPGARAIGLDAAYGAGVEAHTTQGEAQRERIIAATATLLCDKGPAGLNVRAVMRRAGVSRTAFYRQFTDMSDVVGELLERVLADVSGGAGRWLTDADAVGSPAVVYENAELSARNLQPHAELLCAIFDSVGLDPALRRTWDAALQRRIDVVEAAIRRDQAAGAIRVDLDAGNAARALTVMHERIALEVLGREKGTPNDFANLVAPVWSMTLFGVDSTARL